MAALLPTTATSRSVALRFEPDSDLLAGSFLRLTTSPSASATARTIEGSELTAATATARGIGAGYSRYYEGLVDEAFFNSLNLSIASGGGQIDGDAVASAFASGRGDTSAEALATNIGLANLSYLDRYGGSLLIGSTDNPLSASATAGSGSVLGPVAGSSPTSTLTATARVRGLEGSGEFSNRQPLRPEGQRLDTDSILAAQAAPGLLQQPLLVTGSGNTPLFDFSDSGGLATTNLELFRSASATNTLGFYRVINKEGNVRTATGQILKPGEAGYAAAALAPDNLVTELQNLSLPQDGSNSRAVYVDETGLLAPFATLRTAGSPEGVQVFGFNEAAAFNQFLALSGNTLAIEDLSPPFIGQEPDYNDLTASISQASRQPLPLLDFRNSDGAYTTTFTLQRDANYDSVLGYYRVLGANGAVVAADGRVLLPGATDYEREALRPGNLVSELQDFQVPADQQTAEFTVSVNETSLIVPYAKVVPTSGSPYTLFAYPAANQDAIAHFLSTGRSGFSIEDLLLTDPLRQSPREPDNNDLGVRVGSFTPTPTPVILPAYMFYGQPNAVVAAQAQLLATDGTSLQGSATADAKAIDRYQIKAVPFGNGDGTASINGVAAASLLVDGSVRAGDEPISLNGNAVGIDSSLISGAPTLATTITGRGLATIDIATGSNLQAGQTDLQQLQGIGISSSLLFTNQGNDVIRGFGGIAAPQLSLAAAGKADTAGIHATGMYTGLGNDVIFGKILNEVEAEFDADGDGILNDSVFLDRSAKDGSIGGFDGIRNSTANTGIGNDLIAGSSNGSHLYTSIGNDSIDLDRAKASSLWGGIGNDLLRIGAADGSGGPSQNNVLWGGIGNDILQVGSGDGSVFDGGYGQDVMTGGSGVDRFLFSEGGAALRASNNSFLGNDLADQPLWATLTQTQKETLWDTGVLLSNAGNERIGSIDTIRNFQAGDGGDVLEISNSLASVTQELWEQKGAIFGVNASGDLSVQEASADGSNRVGIVVGTLADIQRLGMGSPSIAYATDTRQLMFDADGNWSQGSISMGTVNVAGGTFNKSNFAFGSTTGNGLGEAPTAHGGVG
ncbi:calcium-binding protein [Microcystis elabens FACHB-917]|nr:calcium-binding protein [Microcystis elabens FACHB-917]